MIPALPFPTEELLALLAKATLLLGVAAVAVWTMRRGAAAARHLVWTCAVGGLLLLPLLGRAVPEWPVAVWRAPAVEAERPAAAFSGDRGGAGSLSAPAESGAATPFGEGAVAAEGGHAAPAGDPLSLAGWLLRVWAAGASLVLLWLVVGRAGLRRLRRGAEPLDPATRWLGQEVAFALGLRRPIEVLRTPRATMPMTWGTLRPTVLLPAECEEWTMDRRRAVLLHELAHVRRLDCLTQTLAHLCCALYWFHPGVWMAARRMRAEREQACDDAVIGMGVRPSEYASHLLEIARSYGAGGYAQMAAVAMARPTQLEGRMLAVLDPSRSRGGPTRRVAAAAVVAALLGLLPLSALRPVAGAQQPNAPSGDSGPVAASPPAGARAPFAAAPALPPAPPSLLPDGLELEAPPSPDGTFGPARQESDPDPRVVAALIEALRDESVEVRRAAAYSLGELEAAAAVQPLVQLLGDPDAEVRRMAAWALGEIEDPAAADALGAALSDPDAEVSRTAAWALGEIAAPESVPALVAALSGPDAETRQTAARALGEIEDPRAVDPLIAALRDSDLEVRRMAAWALSEIQDPRAAEPLAALVGASDDPQLRAHAIRALAEMDLASAPDALLAAVGDPDLQVRKAALHALAEIQDPRAVPALRAALGDADADVRRAAIHALVELDDPAALDALIEALRDPDAQVRRQAAQALGDR